MNKTLFLLRGLPGSGKSTTANILSENGKYPVLSADMYFEDSEGNVTFPKKSVIYDPNIKKEVSSFFIQPVTLEFAVDFVVNRNHSDLNKDELRQKVEDHFISRINYYSKS